MKPGTIIRFTRDHVGHDGLPTIRKGDIAGYLGDSKVQILSGEAAEWVFSLLISAGYEEFDIEQGRIAHYERHH